MWGRSFVIVGAMALSLQLAASLAGRAAARPHPEAPASTLPASPAVPAPSDPEVALLDQAVTALEQCRDGVREPAGVSPTQAAGWNGRAGVEMLARLRDRLSRTGRRSAVPRANASKVVAHAGRLADRALRSPDAAVRLTGLEDALRACRDARELLAAG